MRITNLIRREQVLRDIQGNLARLSELETQVATGKRFNRVDQDPQAAAIVLQVERGKRSIDQYARNGTAAQVRLGAEQAVIQQSDDLLREARDLALGHGQGNPPFNASQLAERQLAADQLTLVLEQLVAMGNTKIGDEYIFAGESSTTPAF